MLLAFALAGLVATVFGLTNALRMYRTQPRAATAWLITGFIVAMGLGDYVHDTLAP